MTRRTRSSRGARAVGARARGRERSPRASRRARGAGDGAHPVRGPLQRRRSWEDAWSERGIDRRVLLSPNLGEDLRPLARIVSGGELSRVMLALKTMGARSAAAADAVADADLRRGRRRASAGGWPTSSAPKLRARAIASRCSASPTCRRSRRGRRRTSTSRSGPRQAHGHQRRAARRARPGSTRSRG